MLTDRGKAFGFTLIEAIAVISIIGTLSVIGFGFVAHSAEIFVIVSNESKAYNELWVATEKMSRDIETADSLTVSGVSELTIINSGKSGCANCVDKSPLVIYRLNGTTLERETALGIFPLAVNITVPTGEAALFALSGRLVNLSLTKTEGDISLTLRTSIYPNRDLSEVVQ